MDREVARDIIKREWDKQGECASCGWHGALSEYELKARDPMLDDFTINEEKNRIELPCRNKEMEETWNHRGVRIYYNPKHQWRAE